MIKQFINHLKETYNKDIDKNYLKMYDVISINII